MCASGRVRDSKSDSRGIGMGECASVDEWSWRVEMPRPIVRIPKGYCQLGRRDGNASCKEMSADGQGKSGKLIPVTVELDGPGGGETPSVCLGGTKMRIGEVESHGCRADKSRSQANESRGQAAASTVLNTCETSSMGDGDGTGARLDARGARRDGAGPDGHANRSDVSSGHVDVPGIRNGINTTADATETISTRQNAQQMQNLPINAGRRDKVESRSHAGMPNMRVDTHGIAIHANTAGHTQRRVSTRPEDMKPPDLPTGCTKLRRDGTDRLESHAGTQTARIHVQDIRNKSNKSANMSITPDLPARGAEPCIGVPNRLECPTDASDACTWMQSDADDSIRPTDNLERVRRSQNGCKRSNLPAKSLKPRPEEPRKPGNRADASSGRTHVQSGRIDTKMTARMPEVISITPNEQKPPNLPIGTGCWSRNETDGSGNIADASTTRRGMHSNRNGARTTAKTRETVSKTPIKPESPNSPVGMKIRCIGEADGWGTHADGSTVCRDTRRAGTDAKTAENASKNVKMCQVRPRRPNSPCRIEIETAKRPEQWKHISDNGNNGYAPRNAPIEDLGTQNRKFVFGRFVEVLGSLEDVEASVEVEMAGSKDEECDGDVDGTVSGGNIDSNRVEAARLAAKSQQTRNNAKTQRNDLPVSPGQPANPQMPCHGLPRTNRRRRTITFEPRNISQTRKVKITYLGHANAMRSMWRPGNQIGWPRNLDAECKSQGECRRRVEDYG